MNVKQDDALFKRAHYPLRADLTLEAETADKIRLGTGPPQNAFA